MSKRHSVEEIQLPGGSRGLYIDVPGASVMAMTINFRAGYFLVDEKKWETPHIMEHMAFGANSRFKKASLFQAEFQKNGSYANAFTNDYHVWYETECADFEWQRVLELLILSITEQKFLEDEFIAECGNVQDELIRNINNRPVTLSIELSRGMGFRAHQYDERVQLLKNITLQDVAEHHSKTHTAENLRFVIAGNLTPDRKKIIERLFGESQIKKGGERFSLPDEQSKTVRRPIALRREDVPNVYFESNCFRDELFTDLDWTASSMVTNLLTGTLFSKILGQAREKGLAYSLHSGFMQTKNQVGWSFGGQAQPEHLLALMEIAEQEISKVLNGKISKADLEAVRQFGLGNFQRGAQTVYGIAKGYAGRYFFEDKIEDYFSIPERLQEVTAEMMSSVMQRTLVGAESSYGILGATNNKLAETAHKTLQPVWQTHIN